MPARPLCLRLKGPSTSEAGTAAVLGAGAGLPDLFLLARHALGCPAASGDALNLFLSDGTRITSIDDLEDGDALLVTFGDALPDLGSRDAAPASRLGDSPDQESVAAAQKPLLAASRVLAAAEVGASGELPALSRGGVGSRAFGVPGGGGSSGGGSNPLQALRKVPPEARNKALIALALCVAAGGGLQLAALAQCGASLPAANSTSTTSSTTSDGSGSFTTVTTTTTTLPDAAAVQNPRSGIRTLVSQPALERRHTPLCSAASRCTPWSRTPSYPRGAPSTLHHNTVSPPNTGVFSAQVHNVTGAWPLPFGPPDGCASSAAEAGGWGALSAAAAGREEAVRCTLRLLHTVPL